MPNTIDGVLDWWAANRAEVAAVRSGDDTLNYAELRQWSLHAAAFLAERGLTAGDRLCIQAPNSFEYIAAMLGAIRLGAIAVPINPRIHPRERNDLIGDFEPRLLIVDTAADAGALPEDVQALPIEAIRALRTASGEADPPRGVDEDAIVGIISTSGSTSRPKGVMYSNRTVIAAAMQMLVQEPYCGEGARVLVYPSISTSAGFLPVFQILVFGGTIYLGGAFEPEAALKIIESERITMMMCSTIFFEHCAATSIFPSTDVSSLRAALTGGSPVSRELQRVWTEKGAVLRQIYGQTECSGFATFQSARRSCAATGARPKRRRRCSRMTGCTRAISACSTSAAI
ncbi:MAG: acyl--CoA ligase [Sphingomonas sp.]|uniref:class I adenylate-forming enzyme family protein n=1 Tax=Sphingomonas sp. TaxID=28214 RepID=UPI001AD2A8BF|nr:AMP-binding protein [Sphingomonas sp.]MBN8848628.1 acyl--CoA ligase [Sphingomonas sp.]